MRGRRIATTLATGLAICGAAVGTAAGTAAGSPARAAAAGSPARAAAAIPDLTALLPRALKLVRAQHTLRGAVLYEAEGISRNNASFTTAAGVVGWRFIYDNPTPGSTYASATLNYGPSPKRFGKVTAVREPFLEDQQITRAPKVTFAAALAKLRKAGYRQAISAVVLRWPLFPGATVQYIFTTGNGYVGVNAYTGKVAVVH